MLTVQHVPRVPVMLTGVAIVGSVVLLVARNAAAADMVAAVVLPRLATLMDVELILIHMAQVLTGFVVLTGAPNPSQG